MTPEHFDVVIIGAGFSGIAAAYHLQRLSPERSFVIVEARDAIGGTWDLFRYPGIRSDSDMYTFGFSFRPWTGETSIGSGAAILDYLAETAQHFGIDRHIRLRHRVTGAAWSSDDARWTLDVDAPAGATRALTCGFVITCTGYYDYAAGHAPEFADAECYGGTIVHPQFWPRDLDYADRRVAVIGSGATAVTIAPAMAAAAAKVMMVQRSPSYVAGRPSRDPVAHALRRWLPSAAAHRLTRWKNILLHLYLYGLARRKPAKVRAALREMTRSAVGPDCDVDTHFNPRYNPWDQRLCFVPDNDLFDAIRGGKVEMVTDTVAGFSDTGLVLGSGREIDADIVVTATGLSLQLMGGIPLMVDGEPADPARSTTFRGIMYSGIPNLASIFGYTNAPFTMRADPSMRVICGVLNRLRATGARSVVPDAGRAESSGRPFIEMRSNYFQRAVDRFPRQGTRDPWRIRQNYLTDRFALDYGRRDAGLRFT